ncbi:hypothetical protein [Pseudomonas denitrificans (nom. rej.)]|uniref:Uncharacterized protein n=1 Tax=Pseudomonas denitrificans TaxID=43306 RepID=A0A9X7MW61_PSEDE|nr:hypothetical protein [Pseudomonas denitrificans (nom. rej.)]QEY70518.1 hypothetical protein F1C79_01935 [Pseudomonas denitrificans (nom. rej.)]
MTMIVNPYAFSSAPPVVYNKLVFPLTYDEQDSTGAITLTRSGASGPLVTPAGFEGDGYGTRLLASSGLPSWLTDYTQPVSLLATIRNDAPFAASGRYVFASVCTNSANPDMLMEISLRPDSSGAPCGAVWGCGSFESGSNKMALFRYLYRYETRLPVLSVGANTGSPQAIYIIDSDTMLLSAHYNDTESKVFKIRLSDGVLLGQFSFGTTTYRHIAAFAKRSNGDFWAADYETFKLLRLDLDASFAAGTAVILSTYDMTAAGTGFSIEFVTVSGTEYLLAGNYYASDDVNSRLWVIPASLLSGTTFTVGSQYKRFQIGRRVQGIVMRSGQLLASRMHKSGGTQTSGWIERYDIVTDITSTATDSILTAIASWPAPSLYPEDMAIHPTTNKLYMPTEGYASLLDLDGWRSVWSADFDSSFRPVSQENNVTMEHNGSGAVTIKLNNRAFGSASWTMTVTPTRISIGGTPGGTAGFSGGFSFGLVRNLYFQNGPISDADYAAAVSGSYELNTLTAYTLTLTNPSAETGDTTGWTNETGTIAAKNTANRTPPDGTWYFDGGSNATVVARQRLDLVAQGISATDLDTGAMWAKIRWWQAAFDNNDPGGMGLRMLNGSSGTISTTYSPLAYTLGGTQVAPFYWFPRSYPVTVPTLTRYLDALYNASGRTSGTNNDHYVDLVRVTVYKQ